LEKALIGHNYVAAEVTRIEGARRQGGFKAPVSAGATQSKVGNKPRTVGLAGSLVVIGCPIDVMGWQVDRKSLRNQTDGYLRPGAWRKPAVPGTESAEGLRSIFEVVDSAPLPRNATLCEVATGVERQCHEDGRDSDGDGRIHQAARG
jgi:hypothetical protein